MLRSLSPVVTIFSMPTGEEYLLVYTNTFKRHMKVVPAKHHSLIRDTLEEQLKYRAEEKTRNRKPLKEPLAFKAEWELRFGPDNRFRVFYSVKAQTVILLALGEKKGNQLWIEGEEVAT
jgi:mRNA-degrading endonuclease RelE of RelBE toxin-antitoxin system